MAQTILLADDEEFIALAYKEGLSMAGYNVVVAHDGADALEKLKADKPDLLLLDLIMPKVTGFEVLDAMQGDQSLKDIPVIVLSNLSQHTDEVEVLSKGALDFIVKSNISLEELQQRIAQVLSERAIK